MAQPADPMEDEMDPLTPQERASAWRGPWWWRLRCRLAELADALAQRLTPDDLGSASWWSDDRQTWHLADVREPPYPHPLSVWRYCGEVLECHGTVRRPLPDGRYAPAVAWLRPLGGGIDVEREVPVELLRDHGTCLGRGAPE